MVQVLKMRDIPALILAGGYGKRLRPLTLEKPKPLVEIYGKPILEWQILWLKQQGIRRFIIAVGWLAEKVQQYFGNGSKMGISIRYSIEKEPLGTAGGIKNAEKLLENSEVFFAFNGDIITNLPLKPLYETLLENDDFIGVIGLVPLKSPYGIVQFEKNRVTAFIEKPLLKNIFINGGMYCFRKDIFDYLPERGDIEKTAFPRLAKEGKLGCFTYSLDEHVWIPIDTHKDVEAANKLIPELITKGVLKI